jgi:hypothetical protein
MTCGLERLLTCSHLKSHARGRRYFLVTDPRYRAGPGVNRCQRLPQRASQSARRPKRRVGLAPDSETQHEPPASQLGAHVRSKVRVTPIHDMMPSESTTARQPPTTP